jgi:RNA polymerase sigma-70 factor (ECF subfamily)
VKAALHRGRGKLVAPEPEAPRVPAHAAVDAFCAAFNARDLAGLTALLLDTATVEMSGAGFDRGVAVTTNPRSGILYHSVLSPLTVGVPTRFLDDYVPTPPRAEVRLHRGEHLLLLWYAHRDGDAVRGFTRLAIDGDRITHVRQYLFSPEALAEVAGELGVPYRSNGHGL